MSDRPQILSEIKRRVLIEAGYRCAVPTCRFPITENAHIVSWAKSKDHSYENLVALFPNCHTMYDSGRIERAASIAYKKKLIILNEVYSRFELDGLDYFKTHKRALIPGELLVKRLLEEGLVEHEEEIMIQGFGDGEDILGIFSIILSDKGKRLLDDWSKVEKSLTHDRILANRLAGGFSPPAPTTPSMRVRTGRFTEPSAPEPRALLCSDSLPGDSSLYDVSVRRLTALHSGLPLPMVPLAYGSPYVLLQPF
jgi:hypothetical protein